MRGSIRLFALTLLAVAFAFQPRLNALENAGSPPAHQNHPAAPTPSLTAQTKPLAKIAPPKRIAAHANQFFSLPHASNSDDFIATGSGYLLTLNKGNFTIVSRHADVQAPKKQPRGLSASKGNPDDLKRSFTVARQSVEFIGANPAVKGEGIDPAPAYANFLLGSDPSQWRTHVPGYSRVRYASLYPGIDLVYHGELHHQLEYDLVVAPGADPQQIRLKVSGDQQARIAEDGSLQLTANDALVRLQAPVLYQNIPGGKRIISGGYKQLAQNEFGFRLADYDKSRPLIIDPTINLLYSTYLGGIHEDESYDLVLDAAGNTYIAGRSASQDFPVSANAYQLTRQNIGTYTYDGFVMKFDASGDLLYSTFLGGSDNDDVGSLALDAAGNAYLIGTTSSSNFPVTANALQKTYNGGSSDAFLAELSSDGSQLIYSTYLGTTGNDSAGIIKPDGKGAFIIAGSSGAAGLPTTTGVYQKSNTGQANLFFGRVEFPQQGALKIDQLTYFGGNQAIDPSVVYDLAIDSSGNLYFAGQVEESTFPVSSDAYIKTFTSSGGCYVSSTPWTTGFITKMSSDLSKMLYSSYFGGQTEATQNAHEEVGCAQRVLAMHVDSNNQIYLIGNTSESDFPVTANALRPKLNGDGGAGFDDFVSILSADGTKLVYSTYLGGANFEYSDTAFWDASNNIWIYGATDSTDYPVTSDALQSASGGNTDGALTELSPDGTRILYSTYFGGSGNENQTGAHIGIDANGTLHLSGSTSSTNFAVTPSAFQGVFANGESNPDGTDVYFTMLGTGAIGTIGPIIGGNSGDATITVGGAGFTSGATCKLVQGSTVIVSVLAKVNSGGTSISCTFPLNNAVAGPYDIVVKNPDGTSFTKQGGFTVQSGGQPVITATILGRPKIRTGVPATFDIVYGNSGNVDAYGVPVTVRLPSTFALDIPSTTPNTNLSGLKSSSASVTAIDPNELYYTDSSDGSMNIEMVVPHLAPGENVSIPFQVTDTTDGDAWTVGVTAGNPAYASLSDMQKGLSNLSPAASCSAASGNLQNCLDLGAATFVSDVNGAFSDMATQEGFTYDSAQAQTTFSQYYAAAVADAVNQSIGSTLSSGSIKADTSRLDPHPDLGITVNCCNNINVTVNGGAQPLTVHYDGLPSITTIPAIGNNKIVNNPIVGPLAKDLIGKLQDGITNQIFNSPKNFCAAQGAIRGGAGAYTGNYQKHCGPCSDVGIQTCTNTYQCNISNVGTVNLDGNPYIVNCNPSNPKACKKKGTGHLRYASNTGALLLSSPLPYDAGGDGCDGGGTGGSIDPNYKSGPTGDGSASQYVPGNAALTYSLGFENEPTASLPAAQVVVTDQLDPTKVDLSTLTLGSISFGSNSIGLPSGATNYNTTYNLSSSLSVRIQGSLNADSGLLKWTFTSIDPSTGLPPSDPTIGFLPPDKDGIVGQGRVLFSVLPLAGQSTGAKITNSATVVFDANSPINTPTWLNTLDVDLPSSKVTALPAAQATSAQTLAFTVKWSGTDTGSGIASYSVYVSDNGGAFTAWQQAVTATSASFTGTIGHTYGFYSIATDAAGNVEAAKTKADTSTTITPPAPLATTTTLTASSASAASGSSITLTATVAPPSGSSITPTGSVTFLNGGTTLGTATLDATGKAAYTTTALPVGTDSITAKYAGDAIYSASTSSAVSITIGNPSFTLAFSPSTLSVANGSTGQATLTATSTFGFSSAITFACSGLPAHTTCSFSPSSVTPTGSTPGKTTLTIATNVTSANASVRLIEQARGLSGAIASLGLLLWGALFTRRRLVARRAGCLFLLLFFAGSFAMLSGCGGGSSNKTPKGSSTVTVTATAGSTTQTATIQLTVN